MMMERLPTKLWVEALVRRAQVAGAAAFVLQKGDAERGDVLIKVARLDGTAAVYVPSMNMEGERIFIDLRVQGSGLRKRLWTPMCARRGIATPIFGLSRSRTGTAGTS